ncbi:MAG: Flp pilus assembly protein CpaB [Chloroflexota bacterium]
MIKNLAIGGGSNKMLLFAALLLGLVAAVLVGLYLSSLNSNDSSSTPVSAVTVPVVVAIAPIPAGTTVTPEMLTVKSISTDFAVPTAFTKAEDVVGQTTQVPIAIGEQVLPTKVSSSSTAQSTLGINTPLSAVVPAGMRAITVVIGPVAAAGGLVRPGDHVDLIRNADPVTNSDSNVAPVVPGACYVLQDVQILTIDASIASTDAGTNINTLATGPASGASKLMVIAVTPSDAALVAASQSQPGDASVQSPLWAVLRPFGERGAVPGLATCTNSAPTS